MDNTFNYLEHAKQSTDVMNSMNNKIAKYIRLYNIAKKLNMKRLRKYCYDRVIDLFVSETKLIIANDNLYCVLKKNGYFK